jgi:hypothetical protein
VILNESWKGNFDSHPVWGLVAGVSDHSGPHRGQALIRVQVFVSQLQAGGSVRLPKACGENFELEPDQGTEDDA